MSELSEWEAMEAEWSSRVDASVARMEALALVRLMRAVVEHRQREFRAAEYEIYLAMERARGAKNNLDGARETLEAAMRIAGRSA